MKARALWRKDSMKEASTKDHIKDMMNNCVKEERQGRLEGRKEVMKMKKTNKGMQERKKLKEGSQRNE